MMTARRNSNDGQMLRDRYCVNTRRLFGVICSGCRVGERCCYRCNRNDRRRSGKRFAEGGHTVRGIARPFAQTTGLPFDIATAALHDGPALRAALTDCEIAIHCAAVYAYGTQKHDDVSTVNVDGTRMFIEAARDAGVRRVVITSSSVTAGSSVDGTVCDERDTIGNDMLRHTSSARCAKNMSRCEPPAIKSKSSLAAPP